MCLPYLVQAVSLKNMFWLWKWIYIIVIGNCHSRISHTTVLKLQSCLVWMCINNDFFFAKKVLTWCWFKVQKKFAVMHLEYTGYNKSFVVLYMTNVSYVTGILLLQANVVTVYWHMRKTVMHFSNKRL